MSGGAPWGFRLQGGKGYQEPLHVCKVDLGSRWWGKNPQCPRKKTRRKKAQQSCDKVRFNGRSKRSDSHLSLDEMSK
ncbi:hypothetical protein GDO81_000693 [Engystomops pustulosus]|uniref:Uncharacterized protein n=1 Tax=Engystomops pustulosus TaxID=76066 RepID=A0AAV7D6C9_ENGPU|nr:hypothetical protein GDO81_000693 [Engystomops pustulosus]